MASEPIRIEERQDIENLFARLRRHILIIAVCVVALGGLALLATLFMPKTYTAAAQLEYAPQQPVAGNNQQSDQMREAQVDAQTQTAKSLPVAMRVVETLKLDKDPERIAEAAKLTRDNASPKQAIAATLLNHVDVARVGTTTMFQLSYADRDPLKAANMANAFANAFLDVELARKSSQSDELTARINKRLAEERGKLDAANAALADFRLRNNLLNTPDSTTAEQEISAIRAQLAASRAAAAEAASRGRAAGSGVVGGLTVGPTTVGLANLRSQRGEVVRKVEALAARYRPDHPLMRDAQRELAAIDGQIGKEMASIGQTARIESAAAGSNASSLSASLGAAEARLARNVEAGVQYADLQRRAQDARDVYQQLLTSNVQQSADRALIRPDTRLAAPAAMPLSPSSPNLPVNVFMGMVLGLALGLAIAFLRERWTQKVATMDDVRGILGQNYLNSIPTPRSSIETPTTDDPIQAALVHPLSAYAEAYRNLGTSLSFAARVKTGKVLAITSSLPKEGKTTTSIALARVLAAGGAKVLLVDTDLRRRSVTLELAPDAPAGLGQILAGDTPLESALYEDKSGAHVLPIAAGTAPTPQMFESVAFEELVADLRERYEYIVFDTPPLLAVTDTRVLLRHFDAIALLVRWRETPARAVLAAVHQVESVGAQIAGVALTMVNLDAQASAAGGDPSYYSGYMKDYYTQS